MEEGNCVSLQPSLPLVDGSAPGLTTSHLHRSVTSGAANLIPEMIRQGVPDSDIKVNELERDHWVVIANVFNDWPFRPESLFDEHNFHPSEI